MEFENIRLAGSRGDGGWLHHVIGWDGGTLAGLTAALRGLEADGVAPKTAAAMRRGVLEFADFLESPGRGIPYTAAPGVLVSATKAFIKSRGLRTRQAQEGPWTKVDGDDDGALARARMAFSGMSRAWAMMSAAGTYPFPSPFELSGEQMRDQKRRAQAGARGGRFRRALLASTTFRFEVILYRPPRRTQVGMVRDAVDKAVAAGWPPHALVHLRILADSGCRPSEPIGFTMLDWYNASRFGGGVDSTNKGEGKARTKIVRVNADTTAAMRAYVDGPRRAARRGALTVGEYLRIGDAGDHARLAAEPLLVDEKGLPARYDPLARLFRRTVADTCVDPVTGNPPIRRPTLHWLRHLFVYDSLTLIEAGDKEEARSKKQNLVAYLGWRTGMKMLETYGREWELQRQATSMNSMMDRRVEHATALRNGEIGPTSTAAAASTRAARTSTPGGSAKPAKLPGGFSFGDGRRR